MVQKSGLVVWFLLTVVPLPAQTPSDVPVAAYPFQPYFADKGGQYSGILPDLLKLLNSSQSRWKFRVKAIPSNRRYMELEEGSSHLIFFEDKEWGWEDRKVDFSDIFLQDSERFLTLWKRGRDEKFFIGAEERPLVAVRGYHYRFAGYNTDENVLRRRFQIALVQSQDLIMEALRLGRGETALITSSFYSLEVHSHPKLRDEFLLSQRKDQDYELRVIFSSTSPFTPEDWAELLAVLKSRGVWEEFYRTRGLEALLPR